MSADGNGRKGKGKKMGLADFIGQSGQGESWASLPAQPVSAPSLPEQPSAAIATGGSSLTALGRTEPDFSRIKPGGPYIAYVGNFPFETNEGDLSKFFQGLNVLSIRILFDRATQRSRGQGYVEFADEQSLRLAIGANGTMFLGRPIKIDVAEERTHHPGERSSSTGSSLAARYGSMSEGPRQSSREPRESRYSGGFDRSGMRPLDEHRPSRPIPEPIETPSDWRREAAPIAAAASTSTSTEHRQGGAPRHDAIRRREDRTKEAKPIPPKFSDTDFVFRRPEK